MAIALSVIGTYQTGIFDEGAAEIVSYDPATERLFVINADANVVEILDLADPTGPYQLDIIDVGVDLGAVGGVNSVAVGDGLIAVAVENADEVANGSVAFYDTNGDFQGSVEVGTLPDMVTFTPDGSTVLVANEGEPGDTVDPQGSVSVIDLSAGVANATVATADFTGFDGQEEALRSVGVRIFPNKSVSEDVEPEYIAVAPDGETAWVTLQEANAVAVLDIDSATITDILPLGYKDHDAAGNGIDASDDDGVINIQTWPVHGLYMPDAIASYQVGGATYYVTANEGDSRDFDESRVADLTLDPTAFPDAATLQQDDQLGRLQVSNIDGDFDGDGDYDQLFSYGARSFTIWDETGAVVFDSADDFEQVTAQQLPSNFNSSNDENGSFDSRSDAKGPEPEGVTVGTIGDSTYAFVGLERVGGIMVYDVTDPANATFETYLNNRDFSVADAEAGTAAGTVGDLGPEGLTFISAEDSPNGQPLLVVGNEVSGTTTVYAVTDDAVIDDPVLPPAPTPETGPLTLQILHASDLEGGVDAIDRAANFGAIVDYFDSAMGNTLTLSAGDNVIPGPFFNAALFTDDQVFNDAANTLFGLNPGTGYESLEGARGRIDMAIMNAIGFDASAFGNHEFDTGTDTAADYIRPALEGDGIADDEWLGTTFPYLSANLDFSGDYSLSGTATTDIIDMDTFLTGPAESAAGTETPRIAPGAIFEIDGQQVGVIGATTPLLDTISSPGDVAVAAGDNDMTALAAILQPVIDDMEAQGVNKIILTTHLQQISLEKELVGLLSGVDVIIAGGSDTLQADETDVLRPGDVAAEGYPFVTTNADGDTAVIVSTDGEYSYVGRLILTFDENGIVDASSINEDESGAYATTDEVVESLWGAADPFAAGTTGAQVRDLVTGVDEVVSAQDGNIFGATDVFLEGRRSAVRTEETNLGNLTADANLALAQGYDDTVMVSLKNGGGIRAQIGEVDSDGTLLPPQGNTDTGKDAGDVSELDIVNALRFNNNLVLQTVTHEQLAGLLEHAVAASGDGATPGQFAQVSGVQFSYDTDRAAGDRVMNAAIVDGQGSVVAPLVANGVFIGDADAHVRIVTLGFLQTGGDSYPYQDYVEALGADVADFVALDEVLTDPGVSTFADPGTEQDALAEYLAANYPAGEGYAQADTPASEDLRIQNLGEADNKVFVGSGSMFDEAFYLAANPDVAAAVKAGWMESGAQHFQLFGASENRDPNAMFDASFYLENNPDVAAAGVDAFTHYTVFGWREGRDPSAIFDTSDYLDNNADVAAADMNPLLHALAFGIAEGRYTAEIVDLF